MLRRQGKAVPSSCSPIRLSLRQNDGEEGFRFLKPRRDVSQDSGEFRVILWRGNERGGEGGEMMRQPALEPVPCMLVHVQ